MQNIMQAAQTIHRCWTQGEIVDYLEADYWPNTVEDGYAVQATLATLRGEPVVGWKIAATAVAGRAHINVDQPLAGRLYKSICHGDQVVLPFAGNRMAVAEAEFAFMLAENLPPKQTDYTEAEVASAIKSLHPGLEIPDSRFQDFTLPGTAGLIADNACAAHFVLGEAASEKFDPAMLADHPTALRINGEIVTTGFGSDALEGPLSALVWLANRLSQLGVGLKANQFVTTGVTGKPSPIARGDTVCADLGKYGSVTAIMN